MSLNGKSNAFVTVKNYLSECEAKADEAVANMRRNASLDEDQERLIYAMFLRAAMDNLREQMK